MVFVKSLSTCIASIALLLPMASQAQVEVKEITTRPGVSVKFVYAKATNPIASAILFPDGYVSNPIFANGQRKIDNFLSSDADRFIKNGISVVIADVPSDQSTWNKFRTTSEHLQDNSALMAFLKLEANVPVWAIAHGNGSLSAASMSVSLKDKGPSGVIFTASTAKAPFGVSVAHPIILAQLDQIQVPALVIHHKLDTCIAAKYDTAPTILAALKSSKKSALVSIEGGTSSNNACYLGYHGFQGAEDNVIKHMADWIKATQAEIKP